MSKLPKVGEWWQHNGTYSELIGLLRKPPQFIINDVIQKEDIHESWVIYSNNDLSDYFVVPFYEFVNDWTQVLEDGLPELLTWENM